MRYFLIAGAFLRRAKAGEASMFTQRGETVNRAGAGEDGRGRGLCDAGQRDEQAMRPSPFFNVKWNK